MAHEDEARDRAAAGAGGGDEHPDPAVTPSGLPPEAPEAPPMGVPEDPGEQPRPGPEAMPGIPTGGEPPTAG